MKTVCYGIFGLLLLVGCAQKEPTPEARLVRSVGKFEVYPGRCSVEIREVEGGLTYYITFDGTDIVGGSRPSIKNRDAFFAFVETSSRVWVFNGEDNLMLVAKSGKTLKMSSVPFAKELIPKIPDLVRERLPDRFRDTLKGQTE